MRPRGNACHRSGTSASRLALGGICPWAQGGAVSPVSVLRTAPLSLGHRCLIAKLQIMNPHTCPCPSGVTLFNRAVMLALFRKVGVYLPACSFFILATQPKLSVRSNTDSHICPGSKHPVTSCHLGLQHNSGQYPFFFSLFFLKYTTKQIASGLSRVVCMGCVCGGSS